MAWHTVRQGEDLQTILYRQAGSYDAEAVRNLPENQELFQNRQESILYPGDRIFIPDLREKEVTGASEQRHRFRRSGSRRLILVFHDEEGEPRADTEYELNLDGEIRNGFTDGDGRLDEPIPITLEEATITIAEETHTILIAHLDPIDTTTGIQARLNNLGYLAGDVDGDEGDRTQAAICEFQRQNDLEPTGEIDEQTQQQILDQHGS